MLRASIGWLTVGFSSLDERCPGSDLFDHEHSRRRCRRIRGGLPPQSPRSGETMHRRASVVDVQVVVLEKVDAGTGAEIEAGPLLARADVVAITVTVTVAKTASPRIIPPR